MCAAAAAQSRIAAWNTSVPTTRVGTRRKIRIRPTAISAPLPAEVTPSTKPTNTPSTTAPTLWRRAIGNSVALAFMEALQESSRQCGRPAQQQRAGQDREQQVVEVPPDGLSSSSNTYTPPMAAGTEPSAIHFDSVKSTVFWRQCL